MKNQFPVQEKVRIALGLTLICGMLIPDQVDAKTKRIGTPDQTKKGANANLKHIRKSEQKAVREPSAEPQPSAKAPPADKDLCPACGRG